MDEYAIVEVVVSETVTEEPPQLFDLTGLQKEANSRYGLSAAETLACAQSLYEDGMLSYPRTSSHNITPDMEQTVSALLSGGEGGDSGSGDSSSGESGGSSSGGGNAPGSGGSSRGGGNNSGNDAPHASVIISSEDASKLEKWTNRPDDEKYIANKDVYDNPQYFNQETGQEIWPGQNGDKNTDGFVDGKYDEKNIEVGHKIDRYGGNNGTFFGETGTPIEKRAMSPNSDFGRYNKYEVIKEFPTREGKIAPWFGKPGGGTQFKIEPSFEKEMRNKLRPGEQLIDGMVRMRYLNRV